jgi:type I restriction enzyme S subunit
VEWLGEVPGHWNICALKRVADLKSGESITAEDIEEDGEFPVFGGNGLRGFTTRYTHEGAYALIGRQGALCGNINYATGKFWASEHAVVATPKVVVETHWLGELMRAMNLNQYSVSAAQPGLSVEIVGNLRIPVPPAPEQTAIATFLDRETAKIDALVAEQEKLIALLQEKRQAVISHAVTKGLDSNVPMKDSGVEWLGEVPGHWEVCALKNIVSTPITDGPHETPQFFDEGIPFVSAEAVSQGFINFEKIRGHISAEDHQRYSQKYLPRRGDVYMVKSGATTGVTAIVETDQEFNIWSPLAALRCGDKMLPKYLLHYMRSRHFQEAVTLNWSFGTQQNIGMGVIGDLYTPAPPLEEQTAIASLLDLETAKLDALMVQARTAITLLQERRTALISAAVTGQIDVRGLAGGSNAPDSIAACAYITSA